MKGDRRVALLNAVMVEDEGDRMAFNGADRYLVNLCRLLQELGLKPHVWQAGGEEHTYAGIRMRGLPWGDASYGSLPELSRQFYERTADFTRAIYLAPMLPFPSIRPRAVVVCHGVFWDYPSQPWAHLAGPFGEEWLRRLHYCVTAADLLVSVDTNMLNWIRATWPGHESRQACIPNFVDTGAFRPVAPSETGRTIVLYPRRLDPGRGWEEARAAARVVMARHPEVEFHFVGRGLNDAQEEEARRWAARTPGCKYYWAPMDQMAPIYRQAEIVIIPTRACEGTSLACLEAMASGKAVICGRIGGLTDLVIDGLNGILIDANAENLAGAIEFLLDRPEERRRLGHTARMTAACFSLARWKERWAGALRFVWGDI